MTLPQKTIAAGVQPAAQSLNAGEASVPVKNYSTNRLDTTRLLERTDLVKVAGHLGANLKRSGDSYRGACPIHHGDNPTAFEIYRSQDGKWYWRCHTHCQSGGDAIELVQQVRSLDFVEACMFLAEFIGMPLEQIGFPKEDILGHTRWRQQSDVLAAASTYFASNLAQHPQAQEYLVGRGFTPETILQAGWGYSDSGPGLYHHLQQAGANLDLAYQFGLLRRDHNDFTANGDGKKASPDGYIIIPHQANGHIVYFSSRAITSPDQMPNPKDKSRNLPGQRRLYWATVRDAQCLVIVEGAMDAESLRQWGISALALCGVGSIPEAEIERIKRWRNIYLALDNDTLDPAISSEERRKIADRTAQTVQRLCTQLGPLTMVVLDLPEKDMNSALQAGITAEKIHLTLTQQATPWIEMRLHALRSAAPTDISTLTREILALIHQLDEPVRQRYLGRTAKTLGISLRQITKLAEERTDPSTDPQAVISNGRLYYQGEPLCNFSASIQRELIVNDGINPPSVVYEITGSLASGEPLPTVQVDATQFDNLAWIARHWGVRAILQVPPSQEFLVARAIQQVSLDSVSRELLFTFTGWTKINGQQGFLTSSGFLGANGLDPGIFVDLGANNLRHYALPDPPQNFVEQQLAVKASLDFLRLGSRQITAMLWAAMFAAPLTEIRPLNAVISVYGSTQSGKSTVAHLALCHYGNGFINGHDYRAPIDWTSTKTAIEGVMFTIRDAVTIVDDYAPQFASPHEARSMHRAAEYVVRSVGNRSARSRARADLSQQTTRVPRGLVMMTAENPLIGQSVVGRMIYVGMQRGEILPDPENGEASNPMLDSLQQKAQQGLLAQAMSLYIQHLARHWDELSHRFTEMADASSDWARAQGGLQNRLPDTFGVLNAAQMLALRIFQDLGLLDGAEAGRLAEENRESLLVVISSQAERVAAESPVLKLLTALQSQLAAHKIYLAPRSEHSNYVPPAGAEMVGWYEPQVVYLDTHRALAAAKSFYKALDQNLDILPDAMQQQIAQIPGLLYERDRDGRHIRVAKWISGATRRVLALDKTVILERYGLDISNHPAVPGQAGESFPAQ